MKISDATLAPRDYNYYIYIVSLVNCFTIFVILTFWEYFRIEDLCFNFEKRFLFVFDNFSSKDNIILKISKSFFSDLSTDEQYFSMIRKTSKYMFNLSLQKDLFDKDLSLPNRKSW